MVLLGTCRHAPILVGITALACMLHTCHLPLALMRIRYSSLQFASSSAVNVTVLMAPLLPVRAFPPLFASGRESVRPWAATISLTVSSTLPSGSYTANGNDIGQELHLRGHKWIHQHLETLKCIMAAPRWLRHVHELSYRPSTAVAHKGSLAAGSICLPALTHCCSLPGLIGSTPLSTSTTSRRMRCTRSKLNESRTRLTNFGSTSICGQAKSA